jgi:hypothetical protein
MVRRVPVPGEKNREAVFLEQLYGMIYKRYDAVPCGNGKGASREKIILHVSH